MYFEYSNDLNNRNNKKNNSKIEKSNNSTLVILIFEIFESRNIGRSLFGRSKFWPPLYMNLFFIIIFPNYLNTQSI